jgi:multidrug efflux pump subunit AcrA (membrane-fusion protein)
MSRRKWIYLSVALAVVAIGVVAYRQWAAGRQSEAETLQTATVERGTVTSSIDAGGTLSAALPRWRGGLRAPSGRPC